MISLKNTRVDPVGMKPELLLGILAVYSAWKELPTSADMVITSINDQAHSSRSRHYLGLACDIRSKNLEDWMKDQLEGKVQAHLPGYDFILENEGMDSEHFHLEYDPRR